MRSLRATLGLLLVAGLCLAPLTAAAKTKGKKKKPARKSAVWSNKEFYRTFWASGRKPKLSPEQFKEVQERKVKALAEVKEGLDKDFGAADPRILQAMASIPREYFQYNYQTKICFAQTAYEIPAKTYGVGWGSALSDYKGQAFMMQLAQPKPGDTVLEIGTGSGYNVALISRLVKEAYSIEIIPPLGRGVARIFKPLGYKNVHTRVGNGFYGWPNFKKGFDIIMLTCAAQYIPPKLLDQLKPGGRLVIPIGQPFKHGQELFVITKDASGRTSSKKYNGFYFIPMTGMPAKK